MSKTVYLLGAGVNRGLTTNAKGLKPPLDGDFFQLLAAQGEALSNETIPQADKVPHYKYRPGGDVPPLDQASESPHIYWVYGFIERFWHRSPKDLAAEPFSLEEFLTFLQLEREEARKSKDDLKAKDCLFTELVLEHRLLTYLNAFRDAAKSNPEMARLGRIIYKDRSTVITTNYDTFAEVIVGQASDENPKAGGSSVSPWSAKNSYCVKFSRAGTNKKVFGHIHPLILKLHGSLNWWSLVDFTANRVKPEKDPLFYYDYHDQQPINYLNLSSLLGVSNIGYVLYKPLVIPMTLHKQAYYKHPAIKGVWGKAWRELSKCKNLVIIGYSFPTTDFHIKKLFLDSLSGHNLEELIIVNPDTCVVQRIKDLTHFQKPVKVCKDIGEFLK